MKYLTLRVLSDAHFIYEELLTILTLAESYLNSRLLVPFSLSKGSNPSYSHSFHYRRLSDSHTRNRRDLFANQPPGISILSKLVERWSREYLSQLQEKSKWKSEKGPKVKVSSIVLLNNNNPTSLRWLMRRVFQVMSGKHGMIRVAEVYTAGGMASRAVRKLSPLPLEDRLTE